MELRKELAGDDPFALFESWFKEAMQSELNDPNAASLATATKDGIPSVRMVLVKSVDTDGFRFFTNTGSRKGHDLQENPRAALCFHWKSMRRQVRVMGEVTLLSEELTDQYFHSRSRESQIGSAISHQSHVLESRATLHREAAEFALKHRDGEIPRPEFWRGFIVKPASIEFWMDGANRLHDRRFFTTADGKWTSVLLYP
jgi:pyridoxamine 5'-phosphate oxidase